MDDLDNVAKVVDDLFSLLAKADRHLMSNERAKVNFKSRVSAWATTLDVTARSITVRPMTTKWASCSTTGRLTFDAGLLRIATNLQDYVIVHELLHFHVPNHGQLWKSLMRYTWETTRPRKNG